MTSTRTFLVQIASVPGYQVGQRQFEQSQYLHDLLVKTLIGENENQSNRKQICALQKIAPKHRIVLRSGFSQTTQWGLEPNMFLEVRMNEIFSFIIYEIFFILIIRSKAMKILVVSLAPYLDKHFVKMVSASVVMTLFKVKIIRFLPLTGHGKMSKND